MERLLVYGSYGYTGRLIVDEAVSRGQSPTVAGRDGRKVTAQAREHGLEARTFSLEDDIPSHLAEFDAVLNCAGPFVETAEPLVEACLETETDYLDITGEFRVFERIRRRDVRARDAGVTLLPGVGFDVVPSDCLAAFLADQLPTADRLAIGVQGMDSRRGIPTPADVSRGTAKTLFSGAGTTNVVRKNGALVRVPLGFRSRTIDFGDGPEHAVAIPLGDVVTAAQTTGIENVEVYAAMPSWAGSAMAALESIGWLLESRPVQKLARPAIDALIDGPGESALKTGETVVWGEVGDGERIVRARIRTPNPYALTAKSAVEAAKRVLDGGVPAGAQTPATAFGSEFVLECSDSEREVLETPAAVDLEK
ncbi:saccharopine dehydrogenase [Halostagnicola larsenii XH-48]|uniref:Saccharopine dehydrogenase n=1 Tax=Halostagnicola larsenii XH-48 TaxID=797299 RepID=W0JNY1_9EURY|nr:saccharopine dehydrogenase NADP-binding domain-containing protein [Halostagnicola larsenii]AHF98712.1 saccharopine dehydrogenase [Halostagnicola larsenii XH-48]